MRPLVFLLRSAILVTLILYLGLTSLIAQSSNVLTVGPPTERALANSARQLCFVNDDDVRLLKELKREQAVEEKFHHLLDEHDKWLFDIGVHATATFFERTLMVTKPGEPFGIDLKQSCNGSMLTIHLRPGERLFDGAREVEAARSRSGCPPPGKQARLSCEVHTSAFRGKDLKLADLRNVGFQISDLRETSFLGANLEGAVLEGSNLEKADLLGSEMQGARIFASNLTGADLRYANLSNAKILQSSLKSARLDFAILKGARFEPSEVAEVSLIGASGLDSLRFFNPSAAVKLRNLCKDAGLKREARALTASIKKFEIDSESVSSALVDQYLLGGKLTNFGVQPWNAIAALFALIPVFALFYASALAAKGRSGIWVIHFVDVVEKKQRAVRIVPRRHHLRFLRKKAALFYPLTRALFCLSVGLQFSCLTAFYIGWREFSVGAWISRLQSRPYTLKATGWVRTVSGVQALLGLYFLGIWAITYFGNPFE